MALEAILRSPGGFPQADKLLGDVWVTLEPIYVLKMAHFSLLNVYVPPMFT